MSFHIWKVRVANTLGYPPHDYYLNDRGLVMASIDRTWSNRSLPKRHRVVEEEDRIVVLENDAPVVVATRLHVDNTCIRL